MSVQIIGSIYDGNNKPGDFAWMLNQPQYDDAFFIFNDNEECFVAHRDDPAGVVGCTAGDGNAIIRPYQCSTCRVLGIPTGTLQPFQGYSALTPHVKALIDSAIGTIRQLIASNGNKRVFYSAADAQGDLGGHIFKTAPAVKQYIVQQIRTLGTGDSTAVMPEVATEIEAVDAAVLVLPTPRPQPVTINGQSFNLVAFYYPGHNEPWDDVYQAPFCANFYPCLFTMGIEIKNQMISGTFHCAEAAFQATKWWDIPADLKRFENAQTGNQAYHISKQLRQNGWDRSYAGLGRVGAMHHVLAAKFADTAFQNALLATGDAYLLEHNPGIGKDTFWSDRKNRNNTGGDNMLGITLMKVRHSLGGSPAPAGNYTVSDFSNAVITHLPPTSNLSEIPI